MDIQKSCLHYQGSKYYLLKQHRIQEFIPPSNYDRPYCELFAGSLVVFFNIPTVTYAYLNDIDNELTNFWLQIQNHRQEFEDKIRYAWAGFAFVDELAKDQTDLGRAVAFYIRNVVGTTQFNHPISFEKNLAQWSKKLDANRVIIWNYDYAKAMEILCALRDPNSVKAVKEERDYHMIFYEDPPYYGSEKTYTTHIFDHQRLSQLNHYYAERGHQIILSYNQCPEVERLYSDWYKLELIYNNQTDYSVPRTELVLSNRPFKRYILKYAETSLTSILKNMKNRRDKDE